MNKLKIIIILILILLNTNNILGYNYKIPINTTQLSDNMMVLANGSSGIMIDGFQQLIWFYYNSSYDYALYYNDNETYAIIANNSIKVPFDVEKGNNTGYDNSRAWNNYEGVFLFDSDATDSSILENNGTVNGATLTQSCKIGNCYDFDGINDYIALPDSTSSTSNPLIKSNFFSISLWTKLWVDSNNDWLIDFDSSTSSISYYNAGVYFMTSNTTAYFFTGKDISPTTDTRIQGDNITNSTWVNVVMVYNNTIMKVYYDTILSFSGTISSGNISWNGSNYNDDKNQIGRFTRDSYEGGYAKGLIDSVLIINSTMTQTQISDSYKNINGIKGYGSTGVREVLEYPKWSNNSTSSTTAGSEVTFSVFWNATESFDSYIFTWHNGSNWTKKDTSGDVESGTQNFKATKLDGFEYYDSFETDFSSNWTDAYNNGNPFSNTDAWTRDSGGTPSSSTGPCNGGSACSIDGTYYIYVETSSGYCYTSGEDAAVWMSKPINFDNSKNEQITWYNNMYGIDIGTLTLEENTTGSWNTLWTESGDQGTAWFQNTTDLSSLTGTGNLRFWYECGGYYTGDAALDAINVTGEGGAFINHNSSYITYDNLVQNSYETINEINVTLYVNYYNTTGSEKNNNKNITLWLEAYNGTDWVDEGDFNINTTGYFTKTISTQSVLSGWSTKSNRDIRINARYMDYNDSTHFDEINWTEVEVNTRREQYYLNDTSVSFTQGMCGTNKTLCWSNITKNITSSVGVEVKWYVTATNSLSNTTDVFAFNTTSHDSCTCPGDSSNHEFNCNDNCNISTCIAGDITFIGEGSITCTGDWTIGSLGAPSNNCVLYVNSGCDING